MSALIEAIALLVTGVLEAIGAASDSKDRDEKRNVIHAIGIMILVLIFIVAGSVVVFMLVWGKGH